MEVLYITIPLVLIVGSIVVLVFIWMVKKGQFDDLDGAAYRILLDDELPTTQKNQPAKEVVEDSAETKASSQQSESQEESPN